MKTKSIAIAMLMVAFMMNSCDLLESVTEPASNLPGTWTISEVTNNMYSSGVLEESEQQENVGSITFEDNGTGTYSVEDEGETASGSFEWFEENEKLFFNLLTVSDSMWSDNFAIAWDVDLDTETTQEWSASVSQYEDEYNEQTGAEVAVLVKSEVKIKLEK